ncbi:MAG: serine/threonine protein kinase [Deltaproteobacteria bacterium]|nr:serine/threonine protein kinase [Deltaproteobacteria bacterium]
MVTTSSKPRYDTILQLASGGMATVWVGTVRGALGFRQLVAIKKPHPYVLATESFRAELMAEAKLASMIHHANVVDVRDVETDGDSISLVMDYIEGASLGDLIVAATRSGTRLSPRVVVRIVLDALAGLHAAHELVDERGHAVGLVHRDISPQNILVGSDGIGRVADFGVAKISRDGMQSTSDGTLKGKLAYMAPEYLRRESIDRRIDLFAMGTVLWEALAGKRCFRAENEAETLINLLVLAPAPIASYVPEAAPIDPVVSRALAKGRDDRFATAAEMAAALEEQAREAGLLGGHAEVAAAVKALAGRAIEERRALLRAKLRSEPLVTAVEPRPDRALPSSVEDPEVATLDTLSEDVEISFIGPSVTASTMDALRPALDRPRADRWRPWVVSLAVGLGMAAVIAGPLTLVGRSAGRGRSISAGSPARSADPLSDPTPPSSPRDGASGTFAASAATTTEPPPPFSPPTQTAKGGRATRPPSTTATPAPRTPPSPSARSKRVPPPNPYRE